MLSKYLKGTYSLLSRFVLCFLCASSLLRVVLLLMSFSKVQLTLPAVLKIFGEGLLFDFGVAVFFCVPYALYLLLFPVKWSNTIINKIITYTAFFIAALIIMFSFFAEFTFWQEFESRFNFIAVDYLIYTFEVINNINESYPLPILIGTMLIAVSIIVWGFLQEENICKHLQWQGSFSKTISDKWDCNWIKFYLCLLYKKFVGGEWQ